MMRGLKKTVAVLALCGALTGVTTACGNENPSEGSSSEQQVQDPNGIAWKATAADKYGTMVYQPSDSHPNGEILSTTTRKYDSAAEDASSTRPDGVIFQLPAFSTREPVPFSTSDGPTGFDGPVPIGYTQSAAGAALAASAYSAAYLAPEWPAFLDKVTIGTTESKERLRKMNTEVLGQLSTEEKKELHRPGTSPAMTGVKVEMVRPDYARVTRYIWGRSKDDRSVLIGTSSDLEWVDGVWKLKLDGFGETSTQDQLPNEAWTWNVQ